MIHPGQSKWRWHSSEQGGETDEAINLIDGKLYPEKLDLHSRVHIFFLPQRESSMASKGLCCLPAPVDRVPIDRKRLWLFVCMYVCVAKASAAFVGTTQQKKTPATAFPQLQSCAGGCLLYTAGGGVHCFSTIDLYYWPNHCWLNSPVYAVETVNFYIVIMDS